MQSHLENGKIQHCNAIGHTALALVLLGPIKDSTTQSMRSQGERFALYCYMQWSVCCNALDESHVLRGLNVL
jgi:hypothetical protein